ncbi:MAG: hypothetical protein KF898_01665 [Parachlamydiales bacterium]|nr:hypothetical protein [Verrucomicrobiota bacterium]MBX3718338.1 hypothetical protein [Candidatus Acheromyda pituitae]
MASTGTPPLTKSSSTNAMQLDPPMIPVSNPPPAPTGCWAVFIRTICCCFPVPQQQQHVNSQVEPLTSKRLIENYGELVARTAQLLTHVDLDKQLLLSEGKSKNLSDTAAFIQSHLGELKKMVQHVRYYNDALQPKADSSPLESPSADFDAAQVDVVKRNGGIEKFAEQKIIKGLQEAPFQVPLKEDQIGEIVARVKQQIAVLQSAGVNTGFIRTIVNQESNRLGAQIVPPPFLSQISNAAVAEHLQQVKGFEELTPEDCAALVELIPGYSDVNEVADLVDSSSVD